MKQSLQLRFSQHLALTPQLQQSIRLLQLSTLELNQEIEQMLVENPLLERVDNPLDGMLRLDAQGAIPPPPSATLIDRAANRDERGESAGSASTVEFEAESGVSGSDTQPNDSDSRGMDQGIDNGLDWGADRRNRDDDDDERARPQGAGSRNSLEAHLLQQLTATRCSARDAAFVRLLVGEIDPNGWLTESIETLFADLIDRLKILQTLLQDGAQAAEQQRTELPALFELLLSFAPAGWHAQNAEQLKALLAELLGECEARQTVGELQFEEMQAAFNLLRSFDPPGVGARNLAECLSLQLQRLPRRQWPSVDGWEA
ncbi:MAG: hypothetical protein EBT08_17200, partial [Betaproteobacteria bacterium]|nr:hypothetical protein [Betaproteobacteria bacterium]